MAELAPAAAKSKAWRLDRRKDWGGRSSFTLPHDSLNEPTLDVLDKAMADLDGIVLRRSEADVLTELEAAEDAAQAAQTAAHKAIREQKKAEMEEKREERIAALKAKFSRHHEATDQAPKPRGPTS
jgi:hypothetical protein